MIRCSVRGEEKEGKRCYAARMDVTLFGSCVDKS